jgi:nitroreductase
MVKEEDIITMIDAAMNAPSAGNQQPWQFIIIRKRETLVRIIDFHPHAMMLHDAQAAILICGDISLEKFKGYWVLDCAAATENLLLAAHNLGLGACWLGIYPREDRVKNIGELLKVPKHIIPFSLVSLGYPDEHKGRMDRYLSNRVHYEQW